MTSTPEPGKDDQGFHTIGQRKKKMQEKFHEIFVNKCQEHTASRFVDLYYRSAQGTIAALNANIRK